MTTRKYTSRSQQSTLTSAVSSGATLIPVASATVLLGGATISAGQTMTVVIDPDTALEEIVDITSVSGNNLTVTRAVDMSGAAAQDHSAGAIIRHMIIGRDLREANLHIEATGAYNDGSGTHAMHGLGSSDGVVVGTTATQTLTNKTLTSPSIVNPNISGAGVDASIVFEGTTIDNYETTLTVVDPTQDNTVTIPNTSGTVVLADAAQDLSNKNIDMTGKTLTGLSSAGMVSSSATPKNYVDSILGSATAASTSAASAATSASSAALSAAAAATSATSAAASATAAAASASTATTQATNASNSASAAATSATSAAASATAAATSATSAAASASAAATSATSAAASATTAANSVATIASYATTASNSAAAAATSATSAAASATAAATSATSAAASATAAATSATSAAASATAAAASATSAGGSATAAATSASQAAASATTASNSAAAAATSATSAAASQAAAATSATSAAASATAAATSASSAATSASSAATTYTAYDQRYLGAKASAPTLDNQGNALIQGATYWNTTTNTMYSYSTSTTSWYAISSTSAVTAVLAGTGISITGTTTPTVAIDSTVATLSGSQTLTNKTISSGTLTGTLTAGGSAGTNGYYLQTTGTGVQWAAVSGYNAPTLGSTLISSGATVTTILGMTKVRSDVFTTLDANGYEMDLELMAIMSAW
mgnify:CR=1 FL=1